MCGLSVYNGLGRRQKSVGLSVEPFIKILLDGVFLSCKLNDVH